MTDANANRPPRHRGRALFAGLVVVLLGVAAAMLWWPRHAPQSDTGGVLSQAEAPAGGGKVTLYFGDKTGKGLVTEQREVAASTALDRRIQAAIQALAEGPENDDAVRTLPPETQLRRVFFDDQTATAYLDFAPTLVTRHPGGSTAEYATLASMVRTLGANFPEVTRVQILVDGQPIETLAGHFDVSKPIEIGTWQ